jgi:16S rRNA (cytosine967-C5)-methyltransferase
VGETVAAAPERARGYVNGVLRSLTRLGPPWPEPESLAVALSYPDWLVERLGDELGVEDARATLEAGNERGSLTLRPNLLRTDAETLMAELVTAGAEVTRGTLVSNALIVRASGDPATLPAVAKGRATPQDQGSQAVILYLDPQPGERVLDVAAAPGGKTTAIGERVGNTGRVVAGDTQAGRLRLVGLAARRLRLSNVDLVIADGRHPPVRDASFDRVLVDAPCSGLGVLRRRPEARWRTDPDAIDGLADLQVELVIAAARAVRPGGVLVYAVCTLTKAETSEVATRALDLLEDFTPLAPPSAPWRPWGAGGLLLPSAAKTDGMFVLGLRRAPAGSGVGV